MHAACQRLSHIPFKTIQRNATSVIAASRPRPIFQCQPTSYTCLVRQVTTSLESGGSCRLSTASSSKVPSAPNMAPMLVQEVEDTIVTPEKIELIPVEVTLRRLLLDVAAYIDKSKLSSGPETPVKLPDELADQPIILRFTGGWVRDKLLGVQSHDIDVAINKMTGYQFGLRLKCYLEIPGNAEKYGLDGVATTEKQSQKSGTTNKSKTVGGLHKIEANPEKSKHLETVTTRILGLDIDLVNLRKETYTEDSRNPQMEFGTAEEDALRRDATINAMFYNLNTQQVEDLTGKGHNDMRDRLIRTPLEPYQTFKDDPLRVMRLIRFASRLHFTIDPKALVAMRDPDIKDALGRKISRERIGTELDKALRGPDPHEALRLIFDLGLYETVFTDPLDAHTYKPDITGWRTLIDHLQEVLHNQPPLADILVRDEEERFMAWQLAALVPYRDAPQREPPAPGRKAPPPVATHVAKEGIKSTNKVADIITAALQNQDEISTLVDKVYERRRRPDRHFEGEDVLACDVLGMAIRRWGPNWRCQVMYSFLVEIIEMKEQEYDSIEQRKYTTFVEYLKELNVLDAYNLKPLLDGKTLAKALDAPPGPWMKDALDVVMAWQLRNPASTDPQAAIEEVKKQRNAGELTCALVRHFLKLTIRPLFAKSRPRDVTDTGRKVTTTRLPPKMTVESMDDSINKPWKSSKDNYALELLRWVVNVLEEKTVEEVWHLVIPPVLTLVDDWETKYKQIGARLLQRLLEVTPPALLARTGLGEVFERALIPCLNYMPPVTPEDESVELLRSVYPALLTLSNVKYPKTPHPTSENTSADLERHRVKFLDSIIREGIIQGYTHCSQSPRLIATLSDHLAILLNELGIESVKHLKYILPLLTGILSHPVANAHSSMSISAVKALQGLILNAWPRMVEHRGEVLKGLTLCWLSLNGTEGEGVDTLRTELKTAVRILRITLEKNCDFDADCGVLVAADVRLSGLLAQQL